MWFSDFFKKIRIFPPTDGETPEIGNFHKRPKNFQPICSSYNQEKVRADYWLFFRRAEKHFRLVSGPLQIVPEKFFANSEKAAIFNIFLSKKNFWDPFYSEKTDLAFRTT